VKAVFDLRRHSGYGDEPSRRYPFPKRYIDVAQACVGDWIVYRETRRGGGRQGYVAVARVVGIEPNSGTNDGTDFCAQIDQFLPFIHVVPLNENNFYAEAPLRDARSSKHIGVAFHGKSARLLRKDDFERIVTRGLGEALQVGDSSDEGDPGLLEAAPSRYGFGFEEEAPRRMESKLLKRAVRDVVFRANVCRAYKNTCAVTGWTIADRRIRFEVEAAHIVPVALGGPDVVQNGIALTRTVHWLFDRHLISVDENGKLLVAHHLVPRELASRFRTEQQGLLWPKDPHLRPHPRFLAHHRAIFARVAGQG
jgi:putative restriction endonuclease